MAFICDPCLREGNKVLAPFIIEDVSIQRTVECCEKHLVSEMLNQLQKGEKVTIRRGEIEPAHPAPPRFPA